MEIEDKYFKVCKLSELQESFGARFLINDTDIAVFKIKDEIFVVNNVCPHQQAPFMFEGFVENKKVFCPLHGWCFELKTGNICGNSGGLKSYPSKIIDDIVYVKIEDKKLNW